MLALMLHYACIASWHRHDWLLNSFVSNLFVSTIALCRVLLLNYYASAKSTNSDSTLVHDVALSDFMFKN